METIRNAPALSVLAAAIVEGATLPTIASDPTGRLLLANRAARQIWDLDAVLARRRHSRDIEWFLTTQGRRVDPLAAALRGTPVDELHCELALESGDSREVTVDTRPLTAPDGRSLGALMTVTLGAVIVAEAPVATYRSRLAVAA